MYILTGKGYPKKKEGIHMDRSKKINCTVESCKYNNQKNQECILQEIVVTPIQNCNTKQPDESMCSSYRNGKKS